MIRAARASDADAIAAIWNTVISETTITFTTTRKTTNGLAADIMTRGSGFLVAEESSEILGFATYFPFRNGPGYAHTVEHSIMLAPSAKGKGLGRALMDVLCENARAAGKHSLIAGVSGENAAAIAFHAALGFRVIARLPEVGRKFGRWHDLVLMQKML
ncbi:N-acetyltransferase family protein [Aquicoccus sp. G2-2]|uniref:GNAT family N-acetyltransferase n=1 Tax=Aquicoccus sp. G2-2 TaxID=3092120 RepID=UPI002AE05D6C|nr:N-acetyltransferase family protein [Aquicoccus sp. G2-2]MEA1112903.1 N-acetyltransferase family protein [Aquicoccus sp. G2-2]